jgi:hypothetical protein
MNLVELLQSLLDTLPRCHACENPATRMMMSEHVKIPTMPGWQGYPCERGKSFIARGYSGPSAGAAYYTPSDGTWQWDCCDEHPMPAEMKSIGSWDHRLAPVIRRARIVIRTGDLVGV